MHDITLLQKGDQTEVATDLPDKPTGGGKLGKKGQRRFAPSTGRRWSQFVTIQPAQWGAVWLKIGGEKLEMYESRVSFVFRSQGVVVDRAYAALSQTVTERTSRYLVVLGVIYLCNKCPKMTCVLGCVVTVRWALFA